MIYKFGLIGETLSHSFSPVLHAELLESKGLNGTYDLIEIPRSLFEETFSVLKTKNYQGVNVTIPYKEQIIPLLDELSPQARFIGAVNTVSFSNERTIGYNTDYDGFLAMLLHYNVDIQGKSAAILGSGGVAKAVVKALMDSGISSLVVVSTKRTGFLDLRTVSYDLFQTENNNYDLLINCTPIGMHPNIEDSPISAQSFRAKVAIDLIYNPAETRFMKIAKDLGIQTFNGLYMLQAQAAKSQEIWINTK
jgi:shikimate dehydrogenase